MLRMTKTNVVLGALLVGVPVLLFFQNCAKTGAGSLTSSAALNITTTSDSLTIVSTTDPIGIGTDTISSDKGSIGRCDQVIISDVLLKISSISSDVNQPNDESFEIVESDKSISLDKLTLKVKALKSEKVHNLILILNPEGNKILTTDSVVMELKTSDVSTQAGIKVNLAEDKDTVEGRIYKLELTVNPNDLLVTNKSSCLFKPLVKSATLSD